MFTGIIEEIGTIRSIKWGNRSALIRIRANKVLEDMKIGDSINTNGACLTIISVEKNEFLADIMAETMRKTNLQYLKAGSEVNLERALKLSERLGGHIVSGHIDGTGKIISFENEGNALWVRIAAGEEILKYIIMKGSVAIDGISLTVADLTKSDFSISLIPYTIKDTTLAKKSKGDLVNLECDMVAKYIEKFLSDGKQIKEKTIDMDYLKEHGYI